MNTNSELYTPFDEEEVVAIEFGVKSTLLDGRAQHAAVFDYELEGCQAATPRPAKNQAGILNFLTNLEDASISGGEAEFRLAATENIELSVGASVLDTENKDPGANFDGPWGQSPENLLTRPKPLWNVSLAWNIPMENGGKLRFFTDYWYESDHFKTIVNIRALEVSNSQLNARLTYTTPDENLSMSVFGKNITDEENVVDTLGAGKSLGWGVLVMGQPQVRGVSLGTNSKLPVLGSMRFLSEPHGPRQPKDTLERKISSEYVRKERVSPNTQPEIILQETKFSLCTIGQTESLLHPPQGLGNPNLKFA